MKVGGAGNGLQITQLIVRCQKFVMVFWSNHNEISTSYECVFKILNYVFLLSKTMRIIFSLASILLSFFTAYPG